jgi:hypothetical protein
MTTTVYQLSLKYVSENWGLIICFLLKGEANKFPQTFYATSTKNKFKEIPNYLEQENSRENIIMDIM